VVVLGIDPGSRRCGYGVVERVGARLRALEWGVLSPGDLHMAERLAFILAALSEVIDRTRAEAVSVETAFFGLSPRSALVLGQARGVALAAAARAGLPVFEYAPAEVKRAFTGSGRAEKAQMVRTARTVLGVPVRSPDEADAIAIAMCHLARVPRSPALMALAGDLRAGRGRARGGASRGPGKAVALLRPAVRRFGAAR